MECKLSEQTLEAVYGSKIITFQKDYVPLNRFEVAVESIRSQSGGALSWLESLVRILDLQELIVNNVDRNPIARALAYPHSPRFVIESRK